MKTRSKAHTVDTEVVPATPSETRHLPDGYDDPSSGSFVPVEIRPYFSRSTGRPSLIDDEIRGLAYADARHIALAPLGLTAKEVKRFAPQAYLDAVSTTANRLLTEEYDALSDRVLHHHRLSVAWEKYESAAQRDDARLKHIAANTCPVCGQCDPERIGRPRLHSVLPSLLVSAGKTAPPTFKSCDACHAVAVAEYAAKLATEVTPDWRHPTRLAAVRAAIAPHLAAVAYQ